MHARSYFDPPYLDYLADSPFEKSLGNIFFYCYLRSVKISDMISVTVLAFLALETKS